MLILFPFFCVAGNGTYEYSQKITALQVSRVTEEDLRWELKADEAMVRENGESAVLRRIALRYFLVPGQDIVLSGDRGVADFSTNTITVQGEVRAESYLGISLETESLVWNGNERAITTQDRITIRRPNMEMSGRGMEADLDLESIRIKKDAKTVIY
jgi:LPS export ABC transporter protein LptC